MIDAHVHVVPPRLPGVGSLSPLLEDDVTRRAEVLRRQMRDAGMHSVLAMGSLGACENDPLGVKETLSVAKHVPGLHAIGVMDPARTEPEHLQRVDRVLASGQVVALKGYLGYLHHGPDYAGYRPYYELAARHRIPVIFHTGDTYSPRAKLRFAHPLLVDEVAVDHPEVRFVMAHLGSPWMQDAAQVIYKNVNVWADLSGLLVGTDEAFTSEDREDCLADIRAGVRQAFRYAERPNRFIHGSDWPLAPMNAYRKLIASALPENAHPLIFEENARVLFRL